MYNNCFDIFYHTEYIAAGMGFIFSPFKIVRILIKNFLNFTICGHYMELNDVNNYTVCTTITAKSILLLINLKPSKT